MVINQSKTKFMVINGDGINRSSMLRSQYITLSNNGFVEVKFWLLSNCTQTFMNIIFINADVTYSTNYTYIDWLNNFLFKILWKILMSHIGTPIILPIT